MDLTVTDDEVFADDTDPSCLVTQVANPEADDYDDDFVDPYYFISQLPEVPPPLPPHQMCCLPPRSRNTPPVTLVLDLDETLVHCDTTPVSKYDFTFDVECNSFTYNIFV